MKYDTPKPTITRITKFRTPDGCEFDTADQARRHLVYLAFLARFPNHGFEIIDAINLLDTQVSE